MVLEVASEMRCALTSAEPLGGTYALLELVVDRHHLLGREVKAAVLASSVPAEDPALLVLAVSQRSMLTSVSWDGRDLDPVDE